MELTVQIGIVAALVLALASIAGGVVLYRGSRQVGWRALGMSAVAAGIGVLLIFSLLLTVSSEGEAPEPTIVAKVVSTQTDDALTISGGPGATVSSGMMVPRPSSVDELVTRSDVIVVGIITTVLEERRIGPYGEGGEPLSADEEGGIPVTDYAVQIETVLKGDDAVTRGDTLVLRMFGHFSDPDSIITPNLFTLPSPGDYLLFALGRNPDGTYGSGPEGLLDIDGETVAFADGLAFGTGLSPDQLINAIKDTASGPNTAPPTEGRVECEVTVVLALENPMLVAGGVDPIPSGFDAVNSGACSFEEPISAVTLELQRSGSKVFAQEISLDTASTVVRFPLSEEPAGAIPVEIELGSYDRIVKVTTVDGATKEVRSDAGFVWLLDPASSPRDGARGALIAARRMLVDSHAMPYAGPGLISFEPVEWNDGSLDCSKPDRTYDQATTPGFRLVFEYQDQRYEYHTNHDGSTAAECEIASASTSLPEPPVFFVRQQPAVGPRVVWEAELIGALVVNKGCLRVDRSDADISYLPVWPPDYTLSIEADAVLLLDGAGDVVASVGEEVRVSGGTVRSAEQLDEHVRNMLSADCAGPYWVVGNEVGRAGSAAPSTAEHEALNIPSLAGGRA